MIEDESSHPSDDSNRILATQDQGPNVNVSTVSCPRSDPDTMEIAQSNYCSGHSPAKTNAALTLSSLFRLPPPKTEEKEEVTVSTETFINDVGKVTYAVPAINLNCGSYNTRGPTYATRPSQNHLRNTSYHHPYYGGININMDMRHQDRKENHNPNILSHAHNNTDSFPSPFRKKNRSSSVGSSSALSPTTNLKRLVQIATIQREDEHSTYYNNWSSYNQNCVNHGHPMASMDSKGMSMIKRFVSIDSSNETSASTTSSGASSASSNGNETVQHSREWNHKCEEGRMVSPFSTVSTREDDADRMPALVTPPNTDTSLVPSLMNHGNHSNIHLNHPSVYFYPATAISKKSKRFPASCPVMSATPAANPFTSSSRSVQGLTALPASHSCHNFDHVMYARQNRHQMSPLSSILSSNSTPFSPDGNNCTSSSNATPPFGSSMVLSTSKYGPSTAFGAVSSGNSMVPHGSNMVGHFVAPSNSHHVKSDGRGTPFPQSNHPTSFNPTTSYAVTSSMHTPNSTKKKSLPLSTSTLQRSSSSASKSTTKPKKHPPTNISITISQPQSQESPQGNYSRRDKSLGLLSENFITMYSSLPSMPFHITSDYAHESVSIISIDQAAIRLGVERRRIYDIINVLESLRIVSRKCKNTYYWHGKNHLIDTLADLQEEALLTRPRNSNVNRSTRDGKTSSSLSSSKDVSSQLNDEDEKDEVWTCNFGFEEAIRGGLITSAERYESNWIYDHNMQTTENIEQNDSSTTCPEAPMREKTLGKLSQRFVQFFLMGHEVIALTDASDRILGPSPDYSSELWQYEQKGQEDFNIQNEKSLRAANSRLLKSKIRRLYDVANVLSSLNIIEKKIGGSNTTAESNRPSFRWCWDYSPRQILERRIAQKKTMALNLSSQQCDYPC